MKVTLAFLVLGMVTVAFAAGETNDNHQQLALDNDDDVEIAANKDFVDEERSEDNDDVTGLDRSATAEIEEDEEDNDMAEDRRRRRRRRRRRCNTACRKRKDMNCNKWCGSGGFYGCQSRPQVQACKRSCKSTLMSRCTRYLCKRTSGCYYSRKGRRY